MRSLPPCVRRLPAVAACALALTAAAVTSLPAGAAPSRAAGRVSGYLNPLAGHPWGIYTGGSDGLYPAYQSASGIAKRLLGREARQPRVRWYTSYLATADVADKIRSDIAQEQHGNPAVQVWMATFRLWPHSEAARMNPLGHGDITKYKAWVQHAARGIGSSRVALVLEPDLPVSVRSWRPSVRLGLVRYAARVFSALPNTTVYLDGGSSDWLTVADDVSMLVRGGIQYVHGFAVGSTHHPRTAAEIRYARAVSKALAGAGYAGKHFIVDTSDNGNGYTYKQFFTARPHGVYNDPPACRTTTERACVSLGIPPTTDVTDPAWRLPSRLHTTLSRRCDAFVWIARPWMGDNGHAFDRAKALNLARSTPYISSY